MYSLSSTDGWYDGRPVTSGSTPLNLRSARSSSSTNTSITRTGLSSQIQSSRHSGNSVLCRRSVPSTKRFIRSLRKPRRNHNPRITSLTAFLHNQDPIRTFRSTEVPANEVRLQLHALAYQSRQFPAHAGDAGADQGLVADELER